MEEEMIQALKEMDKKRVEELDSNARKLFDAIMKIADERDKYKSLFENEKSHVDTLKRIINKIEEYIKSQEYFYEDGEENGWDCSIDGYKILDLLKEIK